MPLRDKSSLTHGPGGPMVVEGGPTANVANHPQRGALTRVRLGPYVADD